MLGLLSLLLKTGRELGGVDDCVSSLRSSDAGPHGELGGARIVGVASATALFGPCPSLGRAVAFGMMFGLVLEAIVVKLVVIQV